MRKLLLVLITFLLVAAAFDSEGRRRSQRDVRRDRQANREQIERTRREISDNSAEVGRQLDRLRSIEATMALRTDSVAALRTVIAGVESHVSALDDSILTLDAATARLRADYGSTLRRMRTRRQSLSDLAFIFSAQTFGQAWRRIRYLRQTSASATFSSTAHRPRSRAPRPSASVLRLSSVPNLSTCSTSSTSRRSAFISATTAG